MRSLAALLLCVAAVGAFECPSDTILRIATNHRAKDIEAECHREKTGNACEDQDKADKAWKAFESLEKEYSKLVADCVRMRKGSKMRRSADDHDPNDPEIDHSGHNHRRRRHDDHDPNDPDIDHSGHNHRRRRHQEHDPNDPDIDHSGHNHRRRRHDDHDPNDPEIDHTGHNHRRRRHDDHDPSDPNIDHSGHNHRRRRHDDHDPNDPDIDHSGHNHRRRRHDEHDPNDPNIDHTGHNHRRRRHNVPDIAPFSDPERQQHLGASRVRRQVCKTKASEELNKLQKSFEDHCDRENICLPDEDLPEGAKRDKIKEVQAQRAKKYSEYLLEVTSCNA